MTRTVPRWLVWPAIVLALGAAAAAARWFDPPVITETNVDVRVVKREVVRWKTAKAVDTYTRRTPVLLAGPDGGVVIASIEEHSTRDRSTAEGTSNTDSSSETKTQTTTTPARSRYRVSLGVGAAWNEPSLKLGTTPVVLTGSAGARLGDLPLFLEGWVNTGGSAGVGVSGEF